MRTQKAESAWLHLKNSRSLFLMLVEKARNFPENVEQQCIANRDYETLEFEVLKHLLGR